MSREWFSIGPTPAEEDCAQVGSEGYHERAQIECKVFLNMINRVMKPTIPLRVKGHAHDAGTYHEVCCLYDPDDEAETQEMLRLENPPEKWDETAKAELALELSRLQARHATA